MTYFQKIDHFSKDLEIQFKLENAQIKCNFIFLKISSFCLEKVSF